MKSGLEFFPLNVHLDDKMELIEAEFGINGFAVIVKLYQKIYAIGYYCEWTNEVALLFSKKIGLGGNAVSEIVRAAIKRGIFDQHLYDCYRILTSKEIQENYFEATVRRKRVDVKEEYLLYSVARNLKNVYISGGNVDMNEKNECISEQSRGEESRGEESRGEESRGEEATPPAASPPLTREELENTYGSATVKAYLAKAAKYRKQGQAALIAAAKWMAQDVASGKLKAKRKRETSFDLSDYDEALNAFVPVYRPVHGEENNEGS